MMLKLKCDKCQHTFSFMQSLNETRLDVTSKIGDHVKIDEASPFFLVNLSHQQN